MSLDVRIKNGTSENVPSPDAEENEINIIEEIKNSQNQSSISQDNGINMLLLRRLQLLSPLLFPSTFSIPVLLFIVLIISSALDMFVGYHVGLISSQYYLTLGSFDWDGFLITTGKSIGLLFAISLVKAGKTYIASVLYICWRRLLSTALHRIYFIGINFYSIISDRYSAIDNPDMRMTQDVDLFCSTLGTITAKLVIWPFTLGYYLYKAYVGTGWQGPTAILGFFVVSTIFNRFVMSPIVPIVVEVEKREGNLRFKHMQIRSGSESVAFHVSGAVEATKTNMALQLLVATKQTLFNKQFWLNLCQNMFDYLGGILSYLAIAVPIFQGVYDNVKPEEISSMISQNAFFCIMVISTLSQVVDLNTSMVQLAGVTHRVGALFEALQAITQDWDNTNLKASNSFADIVTAWDTTKLLDGDDREEEANPCIDPQDNIVDQTPTFSGQTISVGFMLQNVTLCQPVSNAVLIKDLNLTIRRGCNLLVMGPSSSGKTSLLRALKGLWPITGGDLARQTYCGPKEVMFLPQKPFLTNGTLREQIIYPEQLGSSPQIDPNSASAQLRGVGIDDDSELLGWIAEMKFESLLERCGGLDHDPNWIWCDVLSPGEVQRVAFLRILFHAPIFAVLDEATAAVSGDVERRMYEAALGRGVTLVSVGHRNSLKKFHDELLELDGKGGWTLTQLSSSS